MYLSKLRSYFRYLLQHWLIIAAVLFFAFISATTPPVWAATVPGSGNATVPPCPTVPCAARETFLPLIKLRD